MQGIKRLIAAFAVAFTIMIALPTISAATALSVGEPWGEFSFRAVDSFADACNAINDCFPSDGLNSSPLESPPWTFTGSGSLIVQDAFFRGDRFEVFDNGSSLGSTSNPVIDDPILGPGCGSDPVICFADLGSSHGIFAFGTGDHSFTIKAIASPFVPPFDFGAAYLCIDSGQGECGVGRIGGDPAIPEPTSMLLLGLGLVAGSFWARRHQLNLKFGLQRAFAWRSSRQRK